MIEDIPSDVMRAAQAAIRNVEWTDGVGPEPLEDRISRAILRERARCVGIVSLYADHPNGSISMVTDEIAAAIRKGEA